MTVKQKIRNILIILICMMILTLTVVFYANIQPKVINFFAYRFNVISSDDNLLVHFIDVDQADAAAINLPDGKVMLIDSGGKEVNTIYINYIKANVLNTKRKDYIDYLVLSHADMDHVGGAMKLLENFNVGKVFLPPVDSGSNGYAKLLKYVSKNCKYEVLGEEFVIADGNYEIMFFEILNYSDTNSSSQIVKLECFGKSFLFLGDVEKDDEKLYIDKYGAELDCDILKVAHHGSKTSTSKELLDVITPNHAVISVGENNPNGHPHSEVLTTLEECGVNVLRTDELNDILFVCGKYYDCLNFNGNYYITRLSLSYVEFVIVVDCLLFVLTLFIVIKKEKNKHITIQFN